MNDEPVNTQVNTPEPRNILDRAKDEVTAWFGDADAAGRRQRDLAVGDHSGKGPDSHLDPDARIIDDISKRLTADVEVAATRIEVAARDGAVTLNGQVTTTAGRHRAEELASSVAGVSQVENRLLVA